MRRRTQRPRPASTRPTRRSDDNDGRYRRPLGPDVRRTRSRPLQWTARPRRSPENRRPQARTEPPPTSRTFRRYGTGGGVPDEEVDQPIIPPDLPRILAIANQKGGVGKTTTSVNLGASLAEMGYRVLVVDLDPQGNATTGLGVNAREVQGSIYDVIMSDAPVEDCIEPTSLKNLFVVPATIDLAGAEIELVPGVQSRAQAAPRAPRDPRRLRLHPDRLPAVARAC